LNLVSLQLDSVIKRDKLTNNITYFYQKVLLFNCKTVLKRQEKNLDWEILYRPFRTLITATEVVVHTTSLSAVMVHVFQTTQKMAISRCFFFAEDGKEMYQVL